MSRCDNLPRGLNEIEYFEMFPFALLISKSLDGNKLFL